jgi:hypothetical protein
MTKYPDLTPEELEEVRQHVVVDSVIKNGEIKEVGSEKFITMAGQFVNIEHINIDLIDRINPFQEAFEILSKNVTRDIFKLIQETIDATRIVMTPEEVLIIWPKVKEFKERTGKNPDINSEDPLEKRFAEAVIFMKKLKAQNQSQ